MWTRILYISLLVGIGMTAGVMLTYRQATDDVGAVVIEPQATEISAATSLLINRLNAELDQLKQRVATLESREQSNLAASPSGLAEVSAATGNLADLASDTPANDRTGNTDPASVSLLDGLVAAGLDPVTAESIARRQSARQLARLELRDKAIREGYIGTDQYRQELQTLNQADEGLRTEISNDTYDKYLYHTGQNNRISVSSVMLGSVAEQTGLAPGDMITRYDDRALYQYRDLRAATIDGERDETVNVTVIRSGEEMTFSLPRGPLGVRLSGISINPDNS